MAVDALTPLDRNEQGKLVATWFEEYQAPLFRYLLRLVGDGERASDLLQDTFLQALTALARQEPPSNPSAWLYRIATNRAYNVLRRRRRWRWLPLHGTERAPDFEGGVAAAQMVRNCLAKLNPKEAEALLLHEHAGLTSLEIAQLTGENPSTIRVRLSRACLRFGALYEQEVR